MILTYQLIDRFVKINLKENKDQLYIFYKKPTLKTQIQVKSKSMEKDIP